jgi:hypothetical protein
MTLASGLQRVVSIRDAGETRDMSNKQRTLDGRVIATADNANGGTPDPRDKRLGPLQPFVTACVAALPAQALSQGRHLGLLLFFIGAADRLWQRYEVDDARFPAFAMRLLLTRGVRPAAAATIAQSLPQLRAIEAAHTVMVEGGDLFEQWVDSHDSAIVLRLPELVRQWDALERQLAWLTDDR